MPKNAHTNTHTHTRRILAHAKNIKDRSLVLLICNISTPSESTVHTLSQGNTNDYDTLIQNIPHNCSVVPIFLPTKTNGTSSTATTKPVTHHKHILQNPAIFTSLIKAIAKYPKNCCAVYTDSSLYIQKHIVESLLLYLQNEIMQQWKNHSTALVLGSRWIKNIWHTLSTSKNHLNFGQALIQGHTLVLGAGPSLDASLLKTIVTHRKKIILLACDTTLPVLQMYNITPDICIILESQYYNIKDFLPSPQSIKGITHTLSDITAFPSSYKTFTHNNFFFTKFAPLSFFTRLQKAFFKQNNNTSSLPSSVPALGSVGINAVYHALKSNADSIALAGLDFGFYKGKSHCIHSPTYNNYLTTCSRTHPWDSAISHFLNPTIHSITKNNQKTNIHHSPKYSNTTLTMYAHLLDNLLSQNKNSTSSGPIYEVHNSSSTLQHTTAMNIEKYNAFLDKSKDAHLRWNTHKVDSSTIHHFLTQEHILAQETIHLLKKLSHKKEIPSVSQWNHSIDFYAYTLPDDPYLLQHGRDYWQKYKVYEKIIHNTLKIVHDISQTLHNKNTY